MDNQKRTMIKLEASHLAMHPLPKSSRLFEDPNAIKILRRQATFPRLDAKFQLALLEAAPMVFRRAMDRKYPSGMEAMA